MFLLDMTTPLKYVGSLDWQELINKQNANSKPNMIMIGDQDLIVFTLIIFRIIID